MIKRSFLIITLVAIFILVGFTYNSYSQENIEITQSEEKWKALDEVVIEKIAQEKGLEPKSVVELEGDMEIFVFSLLAAIGGFVAGFFYRKLFFEKN